MFTVFTLVFVSLLAYAMADGSPDVFNLRSPGQFSQLLVQGLPRFLDLF